MVKSGLTMAEIRSWGGDDVYNRALQLANSGLVTAAEYDDEKLQIRGKIEQPDGWEMPVWFELKAKNSLVSHCPCITNEKYGMICEHVVAIALAIVVTEMDEAVARPVSQRPKTAPAAAAASAADAGEPPCASAEPDFIEVSARPRFSAYVLGSRASLSIEIDAHYGKVIEFPACSLQAARTVYLEDPDDPLVRHVRAPERERAAVAEMARWGFEPGYREGDQKYYLTDPHKVLNFLGAGLPALRRLGWHVELAPKLMALTDQMPSVVPVVTVRDVPGSERGDFDVRCSFDAMGVEVPPAEVQAAVCRGDGFILRDGQTVLLDTAAIESMQAVFRDCATTQDGAPPGFFRVRGIHAPFVHASLSALGSVELEDEAAQEWRQIALERNQRGENAKFEPVALGPLDKVLRPYQKQGVYWMRFLENAGLSGLLADEMGLGKTLQTLTWLSLPRSPRLPALVVCPTSLVRNWEAEAKKFTPRLRTLVISGPERAGDFPRIPEADLVITSYALLQRDFEDAYLGRRFSAVVIDEAQHVKNRQTKNARAVKLLDTTRRLALTGTPVENSVADVWSIFDFTMPGYLGDYESFRATYEEPANEGEAAGAAALARLKAKISPFILRRLKQSVARDLPDKIVKVSLCPMSEEAQVEYVSALARTRQLAGDAMRVKGFAKSKFEILAMLMKLRQIAARAKVEPFMEQLVSAIEGGHRILVFSQFVRMLDLLGKELQKVNVPFCYLDGSTKDRLGECNRFNRSPGIPVFLISLMAGGTGLNLTGADMVIHYDPWWNPAVEDQATDRAHRIGQRSTVYVIKMIAAGSIEEKVLALQRRKQAVIQATVSTTDAAIMERLTAEDVASLLA